MSQSKLQALRRRVLVSVTDLPSEILVDIFLRLPIKALVRVRWTCKLWHAIVTNPDFVEKHRKDSVRKYPGYFYRYDGGLFNAAEPDHNIYYIESSVNGLSGGLNDAAEYDLDLSCFAESIRIPYGAIGYELSRDIHFANGVDIELQSSGGLCAFILYTEECFCICNPFIGEQIKVPIGSFHQGPNHSFRPFFWWCFSYSSMSKVYKIIALQSSRNERNEYVSRGYIYTLGSGSTTWRKLRDDFPFWVYTYGNNVGCEEGNLLFFFCTNNDRYAKIVSLDVELEKYRIWKNPYKTLDLCSYSYRATLLSYGNTVAYGVRFQKKPRFSMWVLRDRVNETWVKEINISLETMRSYPRFGNYREWINGGTLFGSDGMNAILYDAESDKWKSLCYPYSKNSDGSRRFTCRFHRHSPSLVSPKQIMGLAASQVP